MPGPGFCASLTLAAAFAAQPGDSRLAAIVQRMAENLGRVPNYTCTQTVERFRQGEPCRECEYKDRLRLEVAYVGKSEQFAWPGASEFGGGSIFDLVGGGAIVTGDFAGIASHVFLVDRPEFTYAGETLLEGRRTHRYDYKVEAGRTTFGAQAGAEQGRSAYSGSFWADAETLDVLRLDVAASEFPDRLDLERLVSTVSYGRVPIGKSDFLLPRSTEAEILSRNGVLSRNRTEFRACRQYVGESTIRFGEEDAGMPEGTAREAAAPKAEQLPPGVRLTAYLASPVRLDECAVGDAVTFVVAREVSRGAIRVPKGALLQGRIVTLAEHLHPRAFTMLGIRTTTLEFDGRQVEFRGGIVDVIGFNISALRRGPQSPAYRLEIRGDQTVLYIQPGRRQIEKQFQFYWNTLPQEKP